MYKKSLVFEKVIKYLVLQVRSELSIIYNVDKGEAYEDFAGLCDVATDMFEELIHEFNMRLGVHIELHRYHGEQKHSIQSYSTLWAYQHTWSSVTLGDKKLYVDITSQQFQKYYKDIPPYYISTEPPKWFYPDAKNPLFKKKMKDINRRIKVKKRVNSDELNSQEKKYIRIGIIEFLQYEVWGTISDTIKGVIDKFKQ